VPAEPREDESVIKRYFFSLPDVPGWQIALWFVVALAAAAVAGVVVHHVWWGAPTSVSLVCVIAVGTSVGDWLVGLDRDDAGLLLRRLRR
jgi:hypothetical protein